MREHQQRHKCDVLGPSDGAITGQGKATAHRIKRKDPLDWPDSNRCFLMENKPKWFWESGHLITRRFGGENSTQNLTTQTSWLNSEGIRNQASVSHYEALANAFFEQVFGVTLDDFVKEPNNQKHWHIENSANEAGYPISALATYTMPNQKKTFTYQVKVFRDSPKEIAKRIEIKYYCSENSTRIEDDLNVTVTLENAWTGFSLDYQNKNVTSNQYQEIDDSEADETGTDDAASKIYYVFKQNRSTIMSKHLSTKHYNLYIIG